MSVENDVDNLSEAPADEAGASEQIIENAEVLTDQAVESVQEGIVQLVSDIEATQNQIEELGFQSPAVQQAQTEAIASDLEAFRDEVADESAQLQEMLDNLSARLEAIANRPNVAADQQWNLKTYLIGILGVVVPAGAAIIYEIVTRFASNQSADDVPGVSDADKVRLQALVQSLQRVDDGTYWGSLLTYVKNNNPTNADLIYFMQYTEQIFPLTQPFYWSSTSDKLAVIQKLSQALQQGGTIGLIQQLQAGLDDGHGVLLPREIAANCASLALGGSS